MFSILFRHPKVIARHRAGPLADERERFLKHCEARGYARSMLQKIAWILLAVAHCIHIDRGKVTGDDIEQAVNGRRRFKRRPDVAQDSESSRRLFIHITTEWVRSLGCLESPAEVERPFALQTAAFVEYLQNERGLSPATISTRRDRLVWFLESLHPSRDSLQTISIADVDAFIKAKSNRGWKRSSLHSLASSLRSFFRFAEGQRWCSPGMAAAIESPRLYAREGLPEGPSWELVQRLLAGTQGDDPASIRAHAILTLLAVYGFRRSEVAGLALDDLDWVGEQIMVSRPKQRRTQCYPLLPAVGEAILRYLREVRPSCSSRALFLTLNAPVRPLSAPSITALVHARMKDLGVTLSPCGAHCLRHACASHLLASGFSLKEIGDHLGHRAANSTLSYTKVELAGLRQVAELDLGGLV